MAVDRRLHVARVGWGLLAIGLGVLACGGLWGVVPVVWGLCGLFQVLGMD